MTPPDPRPLVYEMDDDGHPTPPPAGLPARVIRASAGSGKTFALSSRYIHLLHRRASPQSILATTFTRKAAGEILQRVLIRLAKAATNDAHAAEVRTAIHADAFTPHDAMSLLRQACHELHRVNVATLDAFFSRITASFWMELGLPPTPAMVSPDDPQIARARLQAIEAMLSQADLPVMADLLRRVHQDEVGRSVTATIDKLVTSLHETYRMAPDRALWDRLPAPELPSDAHVQQAMDDLRTLVGQPGLGKRLTDAIHANLQAAQAQDWPTFLEKGIAARLAQGQTTYYGKELDAAILDAYAPLVRLAQGIILQRLAGRTLATWELLRDFDTQFETLRQQRQLVMFSDLPLKLSRHLGGQPGSAADDDTPLDLDTLYYRLDGQVRHLLLDEFQDTSPLQWDVLRPLAQEITSDQTQDRSFFCVGDVKQSIYSWRGGCSELFDQITDELALPHHAIERLDESYRSSPVILDAVNTVFGQLPAALAHLQADAAVQDAVGDWLKDFNPHRAHHADLPGHVTLLTSPAPAVDDDEESRDDDTTDEDAHDLPDLDDPHGQFVARHVQQLVRDHPHRSLGVLVSTNKMVNRLIHQLQHHGVAASGEGGNPVTDDPAVGLILAAMTLADHPGDKVARHHVAMSPLASAIGLPTTDRPGDLARFSHLTRQALAHEGYAAVVSRWGQALAHACDRRNATRLGQLIELAEGHQPQATSRPSDFVAYVKASAVEEPSPAAVRVMTVHKAKGLEFDIVVLPELQRKLGQVSTRQAVHVTRHTPTGPITGVYRSANKQVRAMCPALDIAWNQEMVRRLRDDLGAFYVALTRARQAMHLILPPLQTTSQGISKKGVADCSLAAILRQTLDAPQDETPMTQQTLATLGRPDWDTPPTPEAPPPHTSSAEDASWHEAAGDAPLRVTLPTDGVASRHWRIIAPSQLEAGAQVHVADLLGRTANPALALGSVIHAMCQRIDWVDLPDAPPLSSQELAEQAMAELSDAAMLSIDDVSATFDRMIASEPIRQALRRPAPWVADGQVALWRERPFAVRLSSSLVRGVMDRVVVQYDPAGRPVAAQVMDFKTDRLPVGGLPVLVDRYRPQLLAYRQAVSLMLDLPADRIALSLLLLEIGLVVPLD